MVVAYTTGGGIKDWTEVDLTKFFDGLIVGYERRRGRRMIQFTKSELYVKTSRSPYSFIVENIIITQTQMFVSA